MNALVPSNGHVPQLIPTFSMSDVARIAEAIAKGGLFGSRDPNAVLTLCLLAQAEGQHPAVVFRDYHIIQGKPAKKADAMLRDFINAGGKVEWHELTDAKADATFTHPSGSARIDWTLDRAKKAKIANPMWDKYPRQMLRSRVISEGVRTVFPGATSGLYEVDEVRDIAAEGPTSNVVEGQFQQVEEPKSELHEQPEESVAQGPKPKAHSALKTKLRGFVHELNGCGDGDELSAFLNTPKSQDVITETQEKLPHLWSGQDWPEGMERPEEFVPLADLIARRERECAEVTAQYMRAG